MEESESFWLDFLAALARGVSYVALTSAAVYIGIALSARLNPSNQ